MPICEVVGCTVDGAIAVRSKLRSCSGGVQKVQSAVDDSAEVLSGGRSSGTHWGVVERRGHRPTRGPRKAVSSASAPRKLEPDGIDCFSPSSAVHVWPKRPRVSWANRQDSARGKMQYFGRELASLQVFAEAAAAVSLARAPEKKGCLTRCRRPSPGT